MCFLFALAEGRNIMLQCVQGRWTKNTEQRVGSARNHVTSATAECVYQGQRDRNVCVFLAFEAWKTVEDNEFYLQEFCMCFGRSVNDWKLFFLNQDEACNQMALCRKAEFPVTQGHMEKCCNTGTFSVSDWLVSYRMWDATRIMEKEPLVAERSLRNDQIQHISVCFSVPNPPVESKPMPLGALAL